MAIRNFKPMVNSSSVMPIGYGEKELIILGTEKIQQETSDQKADHWWQIDLPEQQSGQKCYDDPRRVSVVYCDSIGVQRSRLAYKTWNTC